MTGDVPVLTLGVTVFGKVAITARSKVHCARATVGKLELSHQFFGFARRRGKCDRNWFGSDRAVGVVAASVAFAT